MYWEIGKFFYSLLAQWHVTSIWCYIKWNLRTQVKFAIVAGHSKHLYNFMERSDSTSKTRITQIRKTEGIKVNELPNCSTKRKKEIHFILLQFLAHMTFLQATMHLIHGTFDITLVNKNTTSVHGERHTEV